MPCCPFEMIYDNEFEMIFPNDNVPLFEMTKDYHFEMNSNKSCLFEILSLRDDL